MVVEVGQVQAHGLPVIRDEPIGPSQGMEVLVPELPLHRRLETTLADARISRVEQGQRPHAVGMTKGQGLGDGGTDVVGGHDGLEDS